MDKIWVFAVLLVLFSLVLVHSQSTSYEVDTVLIKVTNEGTGGFAQTDLAVKNHGRSGVFSVSSNLESVSFNENTLYIKEGGEGTFEILIDSKNLNYGIYAGGIKIASEEGDEIIVPVIVMIQTPNPLFEVLLDVPKSNFIVEPGENLVIEIEAVKVKGNTNSVILEFGVENLDGEIIYLKSKSLFVDNPKRLTETIPIPVDAFGDHVVYVKAMDLEGNSIDIASELITVEEEKDLGLSPFSPPQEEKNYYFPFLFGIIIVLVAVFFIFNHYWNWKIADDAKHWNKKIVDLRKIKLSDTAKEIKKLEYQRIVLEKAYRKGYIKADSYGDGKSKLSDMIFRLKKRL